MIDGATPLLAELEAMPSTPEIRRRRRTAAARLPVVAARAHAVLVAGAAQHDWWRAVFQRRPGVPILEVPFGIQEHDPPKESAEIIGVPPDWSVVLWWGGVWPWLDLDTLLAARARLGRVPVSIVVPTATRPGGTLAQFTATDLNRMAARYALSAPEVVPLEHWAPYDERYLTLNRAAVMAFLHQAKPEAALSFRTRAMDALWSATPMVLSAGGEVARLADALGWGEVVAPGSPGGGQRRPETPAPTRGARSLPSGDSGTPRPLALVAGRGSAGGGPPEPRRCPPRRVRAVPHSGGDDSHGSRRAAARR